MMRDMGDRPSIPKLQETIVFTRKLNELYGAIKFCTTEVYPNRALLGAKKELFTLNEMKKVKQKSLSKADAQIEKSNAALKNAVVILKDTAKDMFGQIGRNASANLSGMFTNLRNTIVGALPTKQPQLAYAYINEPVMEF
jgi:hypothetical protein